MKVVTHIKVITTGVLNKLWSILKRKAHSTEIKIIIEVESGELKEEGSLKVDIECLNKIELIDAIAASAKLTKADAGRMSNSLMKTMVVLRNFKAQEPEL